MIEMQNGSGYLSKQYVWGSQYIDELIQIGMATSTTNICVYYFWACQDANYNVIGLVDHTGRLIERYDYTPYGERSVYSHGWNPGDVNCDGSVDQSDYDLIDNHMFEYVTPGDFSSGDCSGDGYVSFADVAIAGNNMGWTRPSLEADPVVSTPRFIN